MGDIALPPSAYTCQQFAAIDMNVLRLSMSSLGGVFDFALRCRLSPVCCPACPKLELHVDAHALYVFLVPPKALFGQNASVLLKALEWSP